MSLLSLKLGSLRTLPLFNYLMPFLVDSPSLTTPRPVPNSCTSSIVGGGTEFLLHKSCKLLSTPTTTFKSYELSSVTIKLTHSNLALYNIYRPPQSTTKSRHSVSFSQILEDFQILISFVSTSPHGFLIIGDFNIKSIWQLLRQNHVK